MDIPKQSEESGIWHGGPQIFRSAARPLAEWQGMREEQKAGDQATQTKLDSSGCFGIIFRGTKTNCLTPLLFFHSLKSYSKNEKEDSHEKSRFTNCRDPCVYSMFKK